MYIRLTKGKRKRSTDKADTYEYLQLVESYRTPNGPRQRVILTMGDLPLKKEDFKEFVIALEERLSGQRSFLKKKRKDANFSQMVTKVYEQLMRKESKPIATEPNRDVKRIDVASQQTSQHRSIGPEYVCHKIWEELGLTKWFEEKGVSDQCSQLIESLVVGRLIEPGSELATYKWLEKRTGMMDLLKQEKRPSLMSYYRAGDTLFSHKDALESYLQKTEKTLFNLSETIILYDLTNTYFEGAQLANPKAQYGRSKEKRSDCKLLTLGLVIDQEGFAKTSKLFSGNVGEMTTLEEMIKKLSSSSTEDEAIQSNFKTVVLDAGIATEANLAWLKAKGLSYVVCHRGKSPIEFDFKNNSKEDTQDNQKSQINKINQINYVQHIKDGDVYLGCYSPKRGLTDRGIRSAKETKFLAQLTYYQEGLSKSRRTKNYQKLLEMLGRLKERFRQVSKLYVLTVVPEPGKAADDPTLCAIELKWEKQTQVYSAHIQQEGTYVLRTNRMDLSQTEIWTLYLTLTRVEKAFRNMKSHLGLRPVFHQLEHRADAHLFISVLAYHILHIIEYRLSKKGDSRSWWTIRKILSTHVAFTLSYDELDDSQHWIKHHVRLCSSPESDHSLIYQTLNLPPTPFKKRKMSYKM